MNENDAAAMIQLHDGVMIAKFALNKPVIRIGRDPESDIFIDEKVVSQEHAVVEVVKDEDEPNKYKYFIKDLGSTNNTYVNDQAITRRRLTNEDLIRIGWTTFRFVDTTKRKGDKTLKIHKSWIPGLYYTKE